MRTTLSKDRFVALAADASVIPVGVEVMGDTTTPVSVFRRLVGDGDGFLLESVEGGEAWGRWSFIGWDPAFTVRSVDGDTTCDAPIPMPDGSPLDVLEALVERHAVPAAEDLGFPGDVPPLHSGAVGYLGYDAVRYVERLPNRPPDDRGLPEMLWQVVGGLAVFDRFRDSVLILRNVIVGDDPAADFDRAVEALEEAVELLSRPLDPTVAERPALREPATASATMQRAEFEAAVERAIAHIREGDAFQIVPSLRFEAEFSGDALALYRAMRITNPSPFMFLVRSGDLAIVGSSPELMSRVRDGRVYSRPIAGTRRRGADPAEDARLEAELLADPKERAEHVMLIDLARNDLGRVCRFGTVAVDDLMVIERYSHVMHIVSGVSGELTPGTGPVEVLRATFPHGTVSGAPKVRAMEIIDTLEPSARGPYAGAVGYIDFSGNLDTAIALRTCVVHGDRAWVQAGAGIVADSDPGAEYDECVTKATSALVAIAAANEIGASS